MATPTAVRVIADAPRTLQEPEACRLRKSMLDLPHIAPLKAYAAQLRRPGIEVPDFDPLDAGVGARLLFLLEKPGPMTAERGKRAGSGFVSRDNDDPTAEAIYTFMVQAGIPRSITAIWNMVPGWNGTRKVTKAERAQGLDSMDDLCKLLCNLAGVVLVGGTAARARNYFESKHLPVITSFHPSPIVRAATRAKWEMIPTQWSEALTLIG